MKHSFFIILIVLFFFFINNAFANSDDDILLEQIKAKEEEIKKLEAEEAIYRQAMSLNQAQSKTLENQIFQIKNRINYLNASLNVAKSKISKIESDIKLHSLEIIKKEIEIKNRKSSITESIKSLARLENQSIIVSFLMNDRFSDFFNLTKYLISFETGLYNNFEVLAQDKTELENFLENDKSLKKVLII